MYNIIDHITLIVNKFYIENKRRRLILNKKIL